MKKIINQRNIIFLLSLCAVIVFMLNIVYFHNIANLLGNTFDTGALYKVKTASGYKLNFDLVYLAIFSLILINDDSRKVQTIGLIAALLITILDILFWNIYLSNFQNFNANVFIQIKSSTVSVFNSDLIYFVLIIILYFIYNEKIKVSHQK